MKIDLKDNIYKEVSEYCRLNEISDIEGHINNMFQRFVTSEIYGEVPSFIKKHAENLDMEKEKRKFEETEYYKDILKELEKLKKRNKFLQDELEKVNHKKMVDSEENIVFNVSNVEKNEQRKLTDNNIETDKEQLIVNKNTQFVELSQNKEVKPKRIRMLK